MIMGLDHQPSKTSNITPSSDLAFPRDGIIYLILKRGSGCVCRVGHPLSPQDLLKPCFFALASGY